MPSAKERHLFQIVVVAASLVPIAAGADGILQGPGMIAHFTNTNRDLDSHFSYLSGLLLGIGVAFPLCVARLASRAGAFRMLGLIVVLGGLGRLFASSRFGMPSPPHRFAYVMELVVMPGLIFWHRRIVAGHALASGDRKHTGNRRTAVVR